MIPRPYQRAAVDALFAYFEAHDGNPLGVMPTGSGKSVVQATFIRETLERWPSERFLLLTHVKELISQNARHLDGALPVGSDLAGGPAVYSAGLGRRELGQVTVAGIQSIYQRAHEVGDVGIVVVDEAHLVSKTQHTMYRRFLGDLRRICPHVKVVGLTATPFRLDSGPLHRGDDRLFTDIAFDVPMTDLIRDGYLASLTTATTRTRADVSGVGKRGGEYISGDLERAMMAGDTDAALAEVETLAADRRSWLVFCVGVDHARQVCERLVARGHAAAVVLGDTPSAERDEAVARFKRGELRALVSVGVLTTGFDAPGVDCLVCLRPTMSPGLWVQICGRGSRVSPETGKANCLVLDFTANSQTHGPVDLITMDGDGNVRTRPFWVCPGCGALGDPRERKCRACGWYPARECWSCHNSFDTLLRECPDCGAAVASEPRVAKHESQASAAPVLSSELAKPLEVTDWWLRPHEKEGKTPSVRVDYYTYTGLANYTEWICVEHAGYARQKACAWWVERGGLSPVPTTVDDALARAKELAMPAAILVERDGKYWRIKKRINS